MKIAGIGIVVIVAAITLAGNRISKANDKVQSRPDSLPLTSAIVDVEAAMFGSRGGGRPVETPPPRSKTVEDRLFTGIGSSRSRTASSSPAAAPDAERSRASRVQARCLAAVEATVTGA